MKTEQTFKVEKKDDKIYLIQTLTSEMDIKKEAPTELFKFKQEQAKLENDNKLTEEQIKNKTQEKNLESNKKMFEKLKKTSIEWEELIKEELKDLKAKLRAEIKVEKANEGWSRMSDPNQKVVVSNEILAKIANKYDLDIRHPTMMELRKEFKEI